MAIRLLQYLMNDDSNLYRQLAAQTNETYSPASPPLQLDSKASSIVLHEMRNAAPLALQINLEYLFPFSASKYWYLGTDYIDRIRRGGSSEQLLKQYADMMDNKFKFVYD